MSAKIKQLKDQAYVAKTGHPPRAYIDAAKKLCAQADIAYTTGNLDAAFMCYYGFAQMYTGNREALQEWKSEALQAMDRLEELEKKIIQAEQQTAADANLTPMERRLKERMAALNGSSTATTATTTTTPAPTTTSAENQKLIDQYTEQHNKKAPVHSTIGQGSGNMADVSQRLFTPEHSAKQQQIQDQRASDKELLESLGAVFPGEAKGAIQHTGYMDSILRPNEEAKFAPMKRLHLPTSVIKVFLEEAAADLAVKLETCGILYGHKYHDEWVVKGILFPEQKGETDRVSTHNEENWIDVIDGRGFSIVGWVHTHPAYTCFLSSIDLHCQASYQAVLPEAIAIVCSPPTDTNGIFTLSQQGLQELKNCRQPPNTFHRHETKFPLFDNAQHVALHYPPGHERHHEVSDTVIPSPPDGVGKRLFNWITNEGLKRYETEVFDLRRGPGRERYYIYPVTKKNQGQFGPSGGHDLPRKAKPTTNNNNNNNNNYNPHDHSHHNHNHAHPPTTININGNGYGGYGGYGGQPAPQQAAPAATASPQQQNYQYPPQQQQQYPVNNNYAAQHYHHQQHQQQVHHQTGGPAGQQYYQQPGYETYTPGGQPQQYHAANPADVAKPGEYDPRIGGYTQQQKPRWYQ